MGKGRDKRKKHEDPAKAAKRHERQVEKASRGERRLNEAGDAAGGTGGLDGEEDIVVTVAKMKRLEDKKREVIERDLAGPPTPRANVVVALHPLRGGNELIIFGGELWDGVETHVYNDLYTYNAQRNHWRQIVAPGGPCPRSSAQGFTYKQHFFVIGGEMVSRTQAQFHHYRDTWRLNTDTCSWDELCTVRGAPVPSARSGHRVAMWRRSAVLMGGFYDNAQESRYYNDVWVLSDLDGAGAWQPVLTPPHTEQPHPRSGHAVAVHEDQLFIYGGYSTEKLNRFQKTQASVHRDLWTLPLAAPTPIWTRVKLGGIPPPIRSGMAFAVKDKKMYLFGGVVDIDGTGGRTNSSFDNDLFVLHLDSTKFFPLVLKKVVAQERVGGAPPSRASNEGTDDGASSSLARDLATLGSGANGTAAAAASDDDDEEDDLIDRRCVAASAAASSSAQVVGGVGASGGTGPLADDACAATLRMSHVELPTGQVVPCRRMNAAMIVSGHTLIVFGGQYEVGKKEVTLRDLYVLNLNRMDTYTCLVPHDLSAFAWLGHDSDSDQGSWEDGSTVADLDALERQLRAEEMDEDDDDDDASDHEDDDTSSDSDDAPPLVPAAGSNLAARVAKAAAAKKVTLRDAGGAAAEAGGRSKVQGKKGMQNHKQQLQEQLSADALVPTPLPQEALRDFFSRTEAFWMQAAADALAAPTAAPAVAPPGSDPAVRVDPREHRKQAITYCRVRYDEATALLEQLAVVERQEQLEMEQLRQLLATRRRLQAEADAQDEADDD